LGARRFFLSGPPENKEIFGDIQAYTYNKKRKEGKK